MARKTMIYIVALVVVAVLAYFGWKLTARGAYESADYNVLESERPWEIRQYPDLMMATTEMEFASRGDDGSFMRLFRYISGTNDANQKVAMTTPVFMERDVDDSRGQMGFVIPKKTLEQGIPQPTNESVLIQKRAGGRFAVIRFAGRSNSQSIATAEQQLRNWMNQKGLIADGDAEVAGYDPPWTPGPWRRNEILIRCK